MNEWLGVFAIAGIVFLIIFPVVVLFDFYWSTPKRLKEVKIELSRIADALEEQNRLAQIKHQNDVINNENQKQK